MVVLNGILNSFERLGNRIYGTFIRRDIYIYIYIMIYVLKKKKRLPIEELL